MLDKLSELSDEEISQLQADILSQFETVEGEEQTPQSVAAMTSLADANDAVKGEVAAREANAQALVSQAAEASSRIKGEEPSAVENETPAEDATEPAEELATAPEAPIEAPAEEITEEVVPEATTEEVAASAVDAPVETPADAPVEGTPADDESAETPAEEEVEDPKKLDEMSSATDATAPTESADVTALSTEVSESSELTTTDAQPEQKEQEAPVTAAVTDPATIEVPEDHTPAIIASASTSIPVSITAGADIAGFTAGADLVDMQGVAKAVLARLHSSRNVNSGDGEQHIVASFSTQYPEERSLTASAPENWAKIQAVVGPEALMASGGFQAPLEVKYDIFGFGTDVRPVRDSLTKFQANRGGIRYIVPPVLANYADAVGLWTAANDIALTTPTTKAKLVVSAASEATDTTDAVTLQMQFGNSVTRAYPELVTRHNELALIQHARFAEQKLLANIGAASTAVTSTSLIGVARDFLVQLGRAAAAYRSRHRLDATNSLRVIAPAWVRDAMTADLALQMPGDSALAVVAEIEGYIAARNVSVTWTVDGDVFGSQSAAALLEFPDTFVWYIFAEGTFLFLDGGNLDLGIVRDSSLVGTNDYIMFSETFEKAVKIGIESLKVTSTISVNGVAAALRDTTGGATAAAIEY
jgi:hypothetical protein